MMYDVAQSYDVGDGSLAEPNVFVIARHFCLVGHYHGTTAFVASAFAALADRGFQYTPLNQEFDPHLFNHFNQDPDFNNKLYLREIIILDSQSTMDFF